MAQELSTIDQEFRKKETVSQLSMALGFRADDENGRQESFRYISSVLAEIKRTEGDDKKDLTVCAPQSLVQCAIDAARLRLSIDARQHAHLIKYRNRARDEAQLQIGFRGYVSKITEHYPDADISAELVWEGDILKIDSEDGFDHYKLSRAGAFQDNPDKLIGVMVVMSFTKGDKRYQHVTTVTGKDIAKIRKKAKFDSVWSEWFTEKAKVAAVKRASKFVFAGVTGLQELIRYDNANNFQPLKAPDAPKAGSIIDNLNAGLKGQAPEPVSEVGDVARDAATSASDGPTIIDVNPWPEQQTGYASADEWRDWLVDSVRMASRARDIERFVKENNPIFAMLKDLGFHDHVEAVLEAITTQQGKVAP